MKPNRPVFDHSGGPITRRWPSTGVSDGERPPSNQGPLPIRSPRTDRIARIVTPTSRSMRMPSRAADDLEPYTLRSSSVGWSACGRRGVKGGV